MCLLVTLRNTFPTHLNKASWLQVGLVTTKTQVTLIVLPPISGREEGPETELNPLWPLIPLHNEKLLQDGKDTDVPTQLKNTRCCLFLPGLGLF